MRGLPHAVVFACVAAGVVRVATAWTELPRVVASHFDAAGRPDGRMARDAFFTSLGVAFGAVLMIMVLCPLLLRHVPTGAINLPHRDYWFAPERRDASMARLTSLLSWFPVPLAVFEVLVVHLTVEANLRRSNLDGTLLWIGLSLLVGSLVVLISRLYREFPAPPEKHTSGDNLRS